MPPKPADPPAEGMVSWFKSAWLKKTKEFSIHFPIFIHLTMNGQIHLESRIHLRSSRSCFTPFCCCSSGENAGSVWPSSVGNAVGVSTHASVIKKVGAGYMEQIGQLVTSRAENGLLSRLAKLFQQPSHCAQSLVIPARLVLVNPVDAFCSSRSQTICMAIGMTTLG